MTRPVRAAIDTRALANNLAVARSRAPAEPLWAVVKADAYGHGAVTAARALVAAGADGLCVASVEEAEALRAGGIDAPILLLEGFFEPAEIPRCAALGLAVVVHAPWQLTALEVARPEWPLTTWVKVDTGMHRIGFHPEEVGPVRDRLRAASAVAGEPGLMTHLARADDRSEPATTNQLRAFDTLEQPGAVSIANSAGILGWPGARRGLLRPGIMLYGVSPFPEEVAGDHGLVPVMTLHSRLIAVRRLAAGDAVGYGGTWTCPEAMPVGVVAIGYGDGYPRHAPSGTPVLVDGVEVPLIGRVSMDMITVDLRGHPAAEPGAPVTLWGDGLPVERVATAAGTIGYELLCGVTRRVPRDSIA
ncbi:alanine racemase [Thiohalospira halophila DSM 15071]|uniref:Alanine racemase n=1 Tax=Thiohalospira halophila DSM 15071 TaxID=1123397 RepID=A0A1I1UF31_9GAMM|nr:alanine racemase [Thiohalospira halophila]SFD69456.1 alanine racemase [Thiohalospira halophila DSM 15071]